ncbi:zinc-binding dehydrogenase [Actinoplanes sp. NPDC049548]|uniref:zinc-binding dehydrogenase n=1 Tax=Actinoplanes sp. NPDC049548 TaxID=3155152 RepID=UPI0034283A28
MQVARHLGAYVIGTAGPQSTAAVRGLGADEVVDYTSGPLLLDGPVDAVVNCAAIGDTAARALPALVRPGGRVVTVATAVPPAAGVAAWHMVTRNDPATLTTLVGLVDAGVIRLPISDRRDLDELPELHRLSEAGALRGKVVVRV